ncbi:TPA: transposase [Aeromonas veronii]|nr:transposase [Aeromonas veronii]
MQWQQAFIWLCKRRRHASSNDDVWHLRFRWEEQGNALLEQVLAGKYRLAPMRCIGRGERRYPVWSAEDALILKWLALRLVAWLPVHPRCAHVKGHGGVSGAQRAAQQAVTEHTGGFVLRTDIQGYYQHIRRDALLALFRRYVSDPICHELLQQFVHYCVEDGGLFHHPQGGLPRGSPLSPLIGAALLTELDSQISALPGLWYLRFMDDFLLMTTRRWPLRRAIRLLMQNLAKEGFSRHPDKTQIGRLERGFDWLGLEYTGTHWQVGPRALQRYRQRCDEHYGRARRSGLSIREAYARVNLYQQRWRAWLLRCVTT